MPPGLPPGPDEARPAQPAASSAAEQTEWTSQSWTGHFRPQAHTTGFLESFIWATEYLQQKQRNGRKGEPQSGRVDRKWFSRVVEVRRLLKDGNNIAAARAWQEFCGGASLEPDSYDTKFLSTFLKQYTDEVKRLQGTFAL